MLNVVRETIDPTGPHLVARAASFLLLADCCASFQIEGERPPRTAWSGGAAPSYKPAKAVSHWTKSFASRAS